MAHSISAKKRIRQNAKNRLANRSKKSALRSSIKQFRTAADSGDIEAALAAYQLVQKRADTISRKGVVHPKTAARIKSRLSAQLRKIQETSA